MSMKRRNFFLTKNQILALQELASKTGLKVSEHIRRAIDAYLEREEKKDEI